MSVKRPVLVSTFAAIGVVLMATSAWAWCSPFVDTSSSMSVSPSSATAGTVVRVTGAHWAPGPVEARWGSPTGEPLGSTTVDTSLSFSMDVRIPNGAPRRSIVVFHTGSVESRRSHPFQVLGQDGAPIGQTDGDGTDGGTTSGRVGGGSLRPGEATGTSGAPAATADGGIPAAPARVPASSTAVGAGSRRPAAPAVAGRLVEPASVPDAAQTPTAAEADQPTEATTAVSPRGALSDLWSGFNSGPGASAAPGLVDLSGASDPGVNPLIVLPLGMVALFAGFGIAELARRRATASVPG